MKRLLRSPWFQRPLGMVLGGIFIYASYHKIVDPPDFAHMVYNYKVTPGPLINLIAIYLPWLELVAGVALVLGLAGRRGAAALVGLMLVVFMAAVGFNLARDHAIDCGCFEGTSLGHTKTHAELLKDMWWVLARDAGMVMMTAVVLFAGPRPSRPRKAVETPSLEPERAPAA